MMFSQYFTSSCLDGAVIGDLILNGFIEAYTCKADRSEAKLYKEVRAKVEKKISNSPTIFTEKMASSPLGPINHTSTIQLLVHLIGTLNSSMPDYDFSELQACDFVHCNNIDLVANNINESFLNYALEAKLQGVRKKFWDILDSVIDLKKCSVYSFIPDDESEVFGEGKVWTMNYFFVNKSAKKIVLFMCSARRRISQMNMIENANDTAAEMSEDEMFECEIEAPLHYRKRTTIDLTQQSWVS
ncbi:hypothetical protein AAMO2058_000381100 [Amorphochlora amoebiformis]